MTVMMMMMLMIMRVVRMILDNDKVEFAKDISVE